MTREVSSSEFAEGGYSVSVIRFGSLLGSVMRSKIDSLSVIQKLGVGLSDIAPRLIVSAHALESSFVDDLAPIAVVFCASACTKIAFAIIQRISVSMVHVLGMSTNYRSMHGHAESALWRQPKTRGHAIASGFPTRMPVVLLKGIDVPRVNKSVLPFSKRQICNAWTNWNDRFSRRLRGHRFSSLERFTSWVQQTLTMTMPLLYASMEVCHQ